MKSKTKDEIKAKTKERLGRPMRTLIGPNNPGDRQFLHRVIEKLGFYLKSVAKNLSAIQIFSEAIETGEGVARQNTAQMADDIAFVIIFGGLNQDNG